MSSLEFINQEIEFLEDMISMDLSLVEDDFDLQEIHKKQQRLRNLKQIKAELEAWYVLKPSINLRNNKELKNWVYLSSYNYSDEKYNKIKKALEVKDE